jgi:hypothetical protein
MTTLEMQAQETVEGTAIAPPILFLQSSSDNSTQKVEEIGQNPGIFRVEEGKGQQRTREEQGRTRIKKKLFLDMYYRTLGSISYTCRLTQIARSTYYEWMERDGEFRGSVEMTILMIQDEVEGRLMRLIRKGHPASIRYYLDRRHPNYMPRYHESRTGSVAGSPIVYRYG